MTLRLPWQPVTHGARTLWVVCVECQARELNETNRLHRAGWQETRYGRGRVFRCGACATGGGNTPIHSSRKTAPVVLACRRGVNR